MFGGNNENCQRLPSKVSENGIKSIEMSKSFILENVKKNTPPHIPLPDLAVFKHNVPKPDLINDFIKTSTGNMSTVVNIMDSEIPIDSYLKKFIADNFGEDALSNFGPHKVSKEVDLSGEALDVFVAQAKVGVAENGCLWLDETIFEHRIAAFSCQHTLIVIDSKNIVPTMHQAYEMIRIDQTGYGVFIAGPSKTADIEQSLVVGAQGAISNTVILF